MTTSPRYPRSSAGNESTSVSVSFLRYFRLRVRTRASGTMATVTLPRARAGATRRSQGASPSARTPLVPTTSTSSLGPPGLRLLAPDPFRGLLSLSAIRMRVVRLHDHLHQFVADDVLVVEVHERDPVDVLDDPDGFHES